MRLATLAWRATDALFGLAIIGAISGVLWLFGGK